MVSIKYIYIYIQHTLTVRLARMTATRSSASAASLGYEDGGMRIEFMIR